MVASDQSKPDLARRDVHRHFTTVTLRYADTDQQGHVNNAVFATFLESGRVAIFYGSEKPIAPAGANFVIARLTLDFLAEVHWPGEVEIGTTVLRLGNSSFTLGQGIFFQKKCVATAETVIVLIDESTRKSRPLPDETRKALQSYGQPV
jgi:acyl-CoA thioester hydrolase